MLRTYTLLFVSCLGLVDLTLGNSSLVVNVYVRQTRNPQKARQPAESLALFYAAASGDYSRIQLLINAGFDVNQRDQSGMTALFPAARNGKSTPEIIGLLVSAGCVVNARDSVGETALLYATDPGGNVENIKALLDADADPNIASVVGETPLIRAADWGSVNILKMLLEKGADPNLRRDDGRTALMTAAKDGEYESVVILIRHKANPNLKDNRGNTALSLAIRNFQTRKSPYKRKSFTQTIDLLQVSDSKSAATSSRLAKSGSVTSGKTGSNRGVRLAILRFLSS